MNAIYLSIVIVLGSLLSTANAEDINCDCVTGTLELCSPVIENEFGEICYATRRCAPQVFCSNLPPDPVLVGTHGVWEDPWYYDCRSNSEWQDLADAGGVVYCD